jgi:uncharacterized protein YjeT (DUF2065 family)
MSSSQESQHSTCMFARVLGPFLIISCVTAVVRASDMRALVTDLGANPVWPWVTGAFMLVGGLIIVALHQCWRGAAAIIVSATGWLLVVRGVFLLAFPTAFMSMANSVLEASALWRTVCVCFALIGLYLTYVGWIPASDRPISQAASSTPSLPRAV